MQSAHAGKYRLPKRNVIVDIFRWSTVDDLYKSAESIYKKQLEKNLKLYEKYNVGPEDVNSKVKLTFSQNKFN